MTQKKSVFYFSPQEKKDLIISWLTLSLAFAIIINPLFFDITNLFFSLPIAMLAVGTGFIFHELAHREAAKHFGFHSEYRAWYPGLMIALGLAIITAGQFIFAAPGATYFFGENVTKKQNGVISVAGPITNILVGILAVIIASTIMDHTILKIILTIATINFWLAFFNMLPIFPLDGAKVIEWNPVTWVTIFAFAGILVFAPTILFSLVGIIV